MIEMKEIPWEPKPVEETEAEEVEAEVEAEASDEEETETEDETDGEEQEEAEQAESDEDDPIAELNKRLEDQDRKIKRQAAAYHQLQQKKLMEVPMS